MLKKINTSPKIPARVIESVFDSIKKAKLKPGESLPSEAKMSDMLGVSHGSLREGLSIMEFLGVIEIKGNKKIVSPNCEQISKAIKLFELSKKDELIFDILELRKIIESSAVDLISKRAKEEDIKKIRDVALELKNNSKDNINLDNDFHIKLAEASHNPFLVAFEELLLHSTNVFRNRSKMFRKNSTSKEEHYKIYEAIASRKYDLAKSRINLLFDNILNSIRKGIK